MPLITSDPTKIAAGKAASLARGAALRSLISAVLLPLVSFSLRHKKGAGPARRPAPTIPDCARC